jgi:hypothetical protein
MRKSECGMRKDGVAALCLSNSFSEFLLSIRLAAFQARGGAREKPSCKRLLQSLCRFYLIFSIFFAAHPFCHMPVERRLNLWEKKRF